jgi:ATP-dependent RNA helicase DHX40
MEEFDLPEIQRTSLTSVALTLKTLGVDNVLDFPYLDPPDERRLLEALKQLYYFDALDREGRVTALGKQMGRLPLTPSLSRVLLGAKRDGCSDVLLPVVSMLCVEQIFARPSGKERLARATEVHDELLSIGRDDFTNLLLIYDSCFAAANPRAWCQAHFVHHRALTAAQRVSQQLHDLLERADPLGGAPVAGAAAAVDDHHDWKRSLPSHAHDRHSKRKPLPASVVQCVRR